MKKTAPIWLAVLFAAVATPCFAKKVHAPLPLKVLTAKTVYIENHASADIADKAYDELKRWGRFQVVESPEKADLVLLLSATPGQHMTGRTQTYDPDMKTGDMKTGGWKYGTTDASSPGYTQLKILDAKTQQILYADERRRSATRAAIKELRKRIEEQEKESKGK